MTSAVYVSGETMTFDDTYFYGTGFASDAEITAQTPNQYGMSSVVLASGQGTEVTLNNPTIQSDPQRFPGRLGNTNLTGLPFIICKHDFEMRMLYQCLIINFIDHCFPVDGNQFFPGAYSRTGGRRGRKH